MQTKRVILLIGVVLALTGAAWWAIFYSGAADRLLQPRLEFLQEALPCMVYQTDTCRGLSAVAGLLGYTVYHPVLIWVAAACLILGLVLPSGRRRVE